MEPVTFSSSLQGSDTASVPQERDEFASHLSRVERFGAKGEQVGKSARMMAAKMAATGVCGVLFTADTDRAAGIVHTPQGRCAVMGDTGIPVDIACPDTGHGTDSEAWDRLHLALVIMTAASVPLAIAAPLAGKKLGQAVGHMADMAEYLAETITEWPARLRNMQGAVAVPDLEKDAESLSEKTPLVASPPARSGTYGFSTLRALINLPSPPTHLWHGATESRSEAGQDIEKTAPEALPA